MQVIVNRKGLVMKKIILVLMGILLLTGCSATYELNIDGENISERVVVDGTTIKEDTKRILMTNPLPASSKESSYLGTDPSYVIEPDMLKKRPDVNYYDIRESGTDLIFTAKFNLKNIEESRLANLGYNGINVNNYYEYQSYYAFDGIKVFNDYPELTNITVKITVNQKVLENDADRIEGNTYYWDLTRENPDKTVYLKLEGIEKQKEENKNNIFKYIIYGLIAVGGIVLIFTLYALKKRADNNKI